MAIPDYQTCMLHLLRLASEGAEHTLKDAVPALADIFQLTDAERTELLSERSTSCLSQYGRVGKHISKESRITAGSSAWRLHYHGSRQKRSRTKSSQDRPQTLGYSPNTNLLIYFWIDLGHFPCLLSVSRQFDRLSKASILSAFV